MDLLDRFLGHDSWTTRQLLLRCRELTGEQLDRDLAIGHGTVRATAEHIVFNMEVWSRLMAGGPVSTDRADDGIEGLLARLDLASAELAAVARSVAERDGWDERWRDVLDSPATEKTYGGAIAHVITHSMHHRAQLLHMLKKLGVAGLPEGDVLSWEEQAITQADP